jgi:tryptophan-rich sensory protein
MRKQDKIIRIICAAAFFAAVAALGTAFVNTSSDWYLSLIKPALQPPPLVFSIVWTVLYALLAASLALVSIMPDVQKKTLGSFAVTGVLNVLWTYTFFELQNPGGAFFVLIITLVAAVALFTDVYRLNKTASYLLVPYIIWLCFALYLNYELAFFN